MEGFLQVWHGFFSRWVKYYFRIHQDTLLFGPKRDEIESKIHLKVAQIISIVDDPISFIIHTGTDTLRLRADSIDERVKWFKKLKKIQKNIQQQNYVKELSSINYEKSKSNRIKMLQSIVLDLWQYHAELESQANDISDRCKSNPGVKTLTEKLRMNVQSIKLKTSQALKIIQQYTKSERQKKGSNSVRGIYLTTPSHRDQNDYSDYQQPNGTMFMSFEQKKYTFKKIKKKQSERQQFQSFREPMNKKKQSNIQKDSSPISPFYIEEPIKGSRTKNYLIQNVLTQKILEQNPAFIDIKKSLPNSKIRTCLAEKFTPQQKFPIGTVLKGSIGADLTKFALPVIVNQPISILQKGCQQMYYSKLLDQANQLDKPQLRMLNIIAFVISQYSLSDMRIKKPFNPLLGETFQFYDEQRQFSFTSQQVSHHPPISAMYCRSDSYELFDRSQGKTTFTGSSIKVTLEGKSKIKLQKYPQEQYIYSKCSICLNNLLVGKTQLQVVGQIVIQCKKTKMQGKITFKEQGFFSKASLNQIEGELRINEVKSFLISGKWNQSIKIKDLRNQSSNTIWRKTHIANKDYYYFNDYTMLLNHLYKENICEMAPTDSRLRPDQRALQYQKLDLAESEKLRLQKKQRVKRKQNQERNVIHKIKWFKTEVDIDGNQFYVLNGNNESDNQGGLWPSYPDIF